MDNHIYSVIVFTSIFGMLLWGIVPATSLMAQESEIQMKIEPPSSAEQLPAAAKNSPTPTEQHPEAAKNGSAPVEQPSAGSKPIPKTSPAPMPFSDKDSKKADPEAEKKTEAQNSLKPAEIEPERPTYRTFGTSGTPTGRKGVLHSGTDAEGNNFMEVIPPEPQNPYPSPPPGMNIYPEIYPQMPWGEGQGGYPYRSNIYRAPNRR